MIERGTGNRAASESPSHSPKEATDAPQRRGRTRFWPPWGASLSSRRLERALLVYREELEAVASRSVRVVDPDVPNWEEHARRLYGQAVRAWERRKVELAWRCFKASTRWLLHGLSDTDLRARAQALLLEATDDKMPATWRRESIVALLTDDNGQLDADLTAHDVHRALHILHEHQDNLYERQDLLRRRLALLTGSAAILLLVWGLLPPPVGEWAATNVHDASWTARTFWLWIFLTSILGAVFSGLTAFFHRRTRASRIPLELDQTMVTVARLVVAPISALAGIVLLGLDVIDLGTPNLEVALALAFAAGFAERLVPRALETWTRPSESQQGGSG